MSNHYDKLRPEALQDILRTRRAYPHEAESLAREVTELRAGEPSADAERWQWFVANYHRMQFDTDGYGEVVRITHVRLVDYGGYPLDIAALNAAIDKARRKP